ncbi:MAG: GIY-YIG nuclease family protein [Pseudomonadota bacterium]
MASAIKKEMYAKPLHASSDVHFIYRMVLKRFALGDVCNIGRTKDLIDRRKRHSRGSGVPGEYDPLSTTSYAVATKDDAIKLEKNVLETLTRDELLLEGATENFECSREYFREIVIQNASANAIEILTFSELEDFLSEPSLSDEAWKFCYLSIESFELFKSGIFEALRVIGDNDKTKALTLVFSGLEPDSTEQKLEITREKIFKEHSEDSLLQVGAQRFLKSRHIEDNRVRITLEEWAGRMT